KVEGEALFVVEAKSESAGNCRRSFRSLALKQLDSLVESLVETLFLAAQRFLDLGHLPAQFGKDISHRANEHVTQIEKKRFVESECSAITNSTTQDPAQDVAAAFVTRLNSVGDREAQRPDVICDNAEGDIDLFLFFICRAATPAARLFARQAERLPYNGKRRSIFLSAQLFQFVEDRAENIG